MTRATSVVLIDDNAAVRIGLELALATCGNFEFVGLSDDPDDMLQVLSQYPDIFIIDMVMPHLDGLQVIDQIRTTQPDALFLVLTAHTDDAWVTGSLDRRVGGFLVKDIGINDLSDAINRIVDGQRLLDSTIARQMQDARIYDYDHV